MEEEQAMLGITVKHHDDISIINLNGLLLAQSIDEAEKIWDSEVENKPNILALNFGDLERLDSMAIGHLIKLAKKCVINDVDLILYGMKRPILDLFKIASLDTFFNIVTSEEFNTYYRI